MLHLQNFPQKTQTGFTLLEALIAMVILIIGVLAWVGTQQSVVLNRGQSRTMTVATELVQSKIEELSHSPEVDSSTETISVDGFDYKLDWDVTTSDLKDSSDNTLEYAEHLYLIDIECQWQFQGPQDIEHQRVVTE